MKLLNSYLVVRAPNDTAKAPKRVTSRRKSTDAQDHKPPKKSISSSATAALVKYDNLPMPSLLPSCPPETTFSNLPKQAPRESTGPSNQKTESPEGKVEPEKKKRQRREINVGGWMSPDFAAAIDRSWLQSNKSPSGEFKLKDYEPQVGDIVL